MSVGSSESLPFMNIEGLCRKWKGHDFLGIKLSMFLTDLFTVFIRLCIVFSSQQ